MRLLLGPTASAALTAAGERAFVVIGRTSYPDDSARWAIHIVPCSVELANAAVKVAKGETKLGRRKEGGKAV